MIISALSQYKFSRRFQVLMAAIVCLLGWARNGRGQEALRISTAGDLAAESRKQAANSIGYYNLLLGPTAWRFSSGLGMQYNDNVHLQQNGGQWDLIFTPNLNTQMHWPVTEQNSLDISLGAGYSFYLNNQNQNQFNINPGSGISFDIYIGDWVFNLHDRISITQNTYETPGVTQNASAANLENTAGASAFWDLNKALVKFGYDHGNFVSLNSNTPQPDSSTENIFAQGGARVLPELLLGLEAGSGIIRYDHSVATTSADATQWNAGVFGTATISDYLSARADAGYTMYLPDATASNPLLKDESSFYFQFLIAHRVNKFVDYSLVFERSTDFSAYGQPQSYYAVRFQPNWHIFEKISLSTPVWWQHGTQLGSTANYDQYGAEINVGRGITKKLSGNLSYQIIKETSNLATLNYVVNIVSLNFTYQF